MLSKKFSYEFCFFCFFRIHAYPSQKERWKENYSKKDRFFFVEDLIINQVQTCFSISPVCSSAVCILKISCPKLDNLYQFCNMFVLKHKNDNVWSFLKAARATSLYCIIFASNVLVKYKIVIITSIVVFHIICEQLSLYIYSIHLFCNSN